MSKLPTTMKDMSVVQCNIHNIQFGCSDTPTHEVKCPKCEAKRYAALKADYDEVRRQRDALLAAIEIKQLNEPLTP